MSIAGIVTEAVCRTCGVTEEQLLGRDRTQGVVAARIIYARLLKDHTCNGEHEIGVLMRRDSSTVHWYLAEFGDRCFYQKSFARSYQIADAYIKTELGNENRID